MRKIQIVWLALFAAFAFSAVAASSAFAEDTQWLWEGNKITSELAIDAIVELLLEDSNAMVKLDMLCSGLFGGVVGGLLGVLDPLLGEISDIEDLEKHLAPSEPFDCMGHSGLLCSSEIAQLTLIHLPWKTELLLETHGGVSNFIDMITSDDGVTGHTPGYIVDCIISGILIENTCEFTPAILLENEPGGVFATFDENEEVNPAGTCTIDLTKTLLILGTFLIMHVGGGTLSVSEE